MSDLELVNVLWDYMRIDMEIKPCDCILGLGCNDFSIPKRCVELYNVGFADIIIFSGGRGKCTHNWEKTEAEKLAKMKSDEKLQYQLEKEKSEKDNALAELNAYKLKEQALSIASEKGLDVSLLSFFNFKTEKAEELDEKINEISIAFNKAVEKAVNEKLKEDTPITKTTSNIEKKTIARASY